MKSVAAKRCRCQRHQSRHERQIVRPGVQDVTFLSAATKGLGITLKHFARNLFLDGNTFESSRKVSKMNLVGDITLGAAVTFKAFRLAFTHVIRTREYKTQATNDQFGAVDLTVRF